MAGQDTGEIQVVKLRPTQYLEAKIKQNGDESQEEVALIILNTPIDDYEYLRRLYEHASFRICADGGANRLHKLLLSEHASKPWRVALSNMPPDLIHGDLDSLQDTVRNQYEQIGVEVTHDPDQYSTDLGKSIKTISERLPHVQDILVVGSLGGRVDQGVGLLHELYREQMIRHPDVRFWLFSEASVSTILRVGTTMIHTPLKGQLIKRNIGILPIYGPAKISTTGLEWDVEDWPTEMGGQVSTSNHITKDVITLVTDRAVLFTVERSIDG